MVLLQSGPSTLEVSFIIWFNSSFFLTEYNFSTQIKNKALKLLVRMTCTSIPCLYCYVNFQCLLHYSKSSLFPTVI